jgi:hypothetical protein
MTADFIKDFAEDSGAGIAVEAGWTGRPESGNYCVPDLSGFAQSNSFSLDHGGRDVIGGRVGVPTAW